MRKLCVAATLIMSTLTASADPTVVYGQDNRKDVYMTSNAMHLKLARSTAAMIPGGSFLPTSKKNVYDIQASSLEVSQNVCPSEKFSQQPAAAMCSGFLVGEDTIVTAGHCFRANKMSPEKICQGTVWVFDFHKSSSAAKPEKNVSVANIYLCKKVIEATLNSQHDYAVIKLDRKVVGREPLKFRTEGKIAENANLVVIGNPTGLPTKISDGGKVLYNLNSNTFVTNLDTFHGNSGSAVFDATTGVIEGILIQGKTDYVPSLASNINSCQVVNNCDETGKKCSPKAGNRDPSGEIVYRISQIAGVIKKANLTK